MSDKEKLHFTKLYLDINDDDISDILLSLNREKHIRDYEEKFIDISTVIKDYNDNIDELEKVVFKYNTFVEIINNIGENIFIYDDIFFDFKLGKIIKKRGKNDKIKKIENKYKKIILPNNYFIQNDDLVQLINQININKIKIKIMIKNINKIIKNIT